MYMQTFRYKRLSSAFTLSAPYMKYLQTETSQQNALTLGLLT